MGAGFGRGGDDGRGGGAVVALVDHHHGGVEAGSRIGGGRGGRGSGLGQLQRTGRLRWRGWRGRGHRDGVGGGRRRGRRRGGGLLAGVVGAGLPAGAKRDKDDDAQHHGDGDAQGHVPG